MIKVGIVTERNESTMKIRAQIPDLDGIVTYWIPILISAAGGNKVYHLPDVGEEVLIGFLDNGIEQGFCLGSTYNAKDKPPVNSGDKFHVTFKDGSVIEYDRSSHTLIASIPNGTFVINAKSVTIQGDLIVNGDINSTGSIMDAAGNTNHHSHS